MLEDDHRIVAGFLHRAVELSLQLQNETGARLLKDFVRAASESQGEAANGIKVLRKEVREFARRWPLPGVDVANLTRPAGIEEDD
jgi:glycine hydroxymethyltransferase